MPAEIIKALPDRPGEAFDRCREVVIGGGVLAYPTDTYYGLGADPRNTAALGRLFRIKGRSADQPILLLIGSPHDVQDWAAEVTREAERLMRLHWPGPLTLVFRARSDVSSLLTAGTGTIGLRVPGNPFTRHLLQHLGTALTGTSANRSGRESPLTAVQALSELGEDIDLVLDGGRTAGGKPSTIADVGGDHIRIIRQGAVTLD